MMRHLPAVLLSCLLAGCAVVVAPPAAGPSASPRPAAKSPKPSATRQPPMEEPFPDTTTPARDLPAPNADGGYDYRPVLTQRVESNCGGTAGKRTVIAADGTITWLEPSFEGDVPKGSRQLTPDEVAALLAAIERADPVKQLRAAAAETGGGSSGGCSVAWYTDFTLADGTVVAIGSGLPAGALTEVYAVLDGFKPAPSPAPSATMAP